MPIQAKTLSRPIQRGQGRHPQRATLSWLLRDGN
jgi:hypothetical protein